MACTTVSTPSPSPVSTCRASASVRSTTVGTSTTSGASGVKATSTVMTVPSGRSDPPTGAWPMTAPAGNTCDGTSTAVTPKASSANSALSSSRSHCRPMRSGTSTVSGCGGSVVGGGLGGGVGKSAAAMSAWAAVIISRQIIAG